MITKSQPKGTSLSRVVVLGSNGFVGKDLMRRLGQSGVKTLGLTSKDVDLTQPESVNRLKEIVQADDSLVFISALTPDRGRDVRTMMKNLIMGEHVAAFLEQKPCAHFVYVSSDALYDDNANPVREDTPANASSYHGFMHAGRELILKTALAKAKVPFVFLRPCAVYGAGDTHNSYGPNRFIRQALKDGKIPLFGGGEEKRDHVYIEDVSEIIALCLEQRAEGVLNIATGQAVSFMDVAQMVARLQPAKIETSPRNNPVTHRHFDITATIKAFPSFGFTSLEQGLAKSLRSLVEPR